jgi:hypothetical protein
MTQEEKIEYLANKLDETLELLRYFIMVDRGLDRDTTDFLEQRVYEILWGNEVGDETALNQEVDK